MQNEEEKKVEGLRITLNDVLFLEYRITKLNIAHKTELYING